MFEMFYSDFKGLLAIVILLGIAKYCFSLAIKLEDREYEREQKKLTKKK